MIFINRKRYKTKTLFVFSNVSVIFDQNSFCYWIAVSNIVTKKSFVGWENVWDISFYLDVWMFHYCSTCILSSTRHFIWCWDWIFVNTQAQKNFLRRLRHYIPQESNYVLSLFLPFYNNVCLRRFLTNSGCNGNK